MRLCAGPDVALLTSAARCSLHRVRVRGSALDRPATVHAKRDVHATAPPRSLAAQRSRTLHTTVQRACSHWKAGRVSVAGQAVATTTSRRRTGLTGDTTGQGVRQHPNLCLTGCGTGGLTGDLGEAIVRACLWGGGSSGGWTALGAPTRPPAIARTPTPQPVRNHGIYIESMGQPRH